LRQFHKANSSRTSQTHSVVFLAGASWPSPPGWIASELVAGIARPTPIGLRPHCAGDGQKQEAAITSPKVEDEHACSSIGGNG